MQLNYIMDTEENLVCPSAAFSKSDSKSRQFCLMQLNYIIVADEDTVCPSAAFSKDVPQAICFTFNYIVLKGF